MNATTESNSETAPSLNAMLRSGATAAQIESYLDALPYEERLREVLAVKGSGVKRLYDAVASARPLTSDEVVPASAKVGETFIWEGRNSLPLFSSFQKRFMRTKEGQIVGYNHQAMGFITGPGYFMLHEATGEEPNPTELFFDYTQSPTHKPSDWPAYKPNERGLSALVYAHMHDYMRRVARGVMVGKAYKKGVDQGQYFSLTRDV